MDDALLMGVIQGIGDGGDSQEDLLTGIKLGFRDQCLREFPR